MQQPAKLQRVVILSSLGSTPSASANKEREMNAKQFAWLYLIEYGTAGKKPSFYGGFETVDKRLCDIKLKKSDHFSGLQYNDFYIHEIKTIGIDWEKTKAPTSDSISQFTDTFHDPEYKEFIVGEIVLNNGAIQSWCAQSIEVGNVFGMMENLEQIKIKYQEIFNI